MEFLTFIEIVGIALFTFSALNNYSAKDVHIIQKVLIYIGWFLSFIIIALLPTDVFYVRKKIFPHIPGKNKLSSAVLMI